MHLRSYFLFLNSAFAGLKKGCKYLKFQFNLRIIKIPKYSYFFLSWSNLSEKSKLTYFLNLFRLVFSAQVNFSYLSLLRFCFYLFASVSCMCLFDSQSH